MRVSRIEEFVKDYRKCNGLGVSVKEEILINNILHNVLDYKIYFIDLIEQRKMNGKFDKIYLNQLKLIRKEIEYSFNHLYDLYLKPHKIIYDNQYMGRKLI